MISSWHPIGGAAELALTLNRGRPHRVLVLPALFDEANKLRHFTVEVMRLLDRGGVDSVLPDLPGCNESLAPLPEQTLAGWRDAAAEAARHFGATHILALRGGALVAPPLPGWRYAAIGGDAMLRALLRARILASKEAGQAEQRDDLLQQAHMAGLTLAGYALGPQLVRQLEHAQPQTLTDIAQAQIGGAGLWLRAEPDHDARQAQALAAFVLDALA